MSPRQILGMASSLRASSGTESLEELPRFALLLVNDIREAGWIPSKHLG